MELGNKCFFVAKFIRFLIGQFFRKMFKTLAQPCIRTTKYPIHQIGVRKSIFPSIIFQSKCGQKRKLARIGSLRTKNELTKPSIGITISQFNPNDID